jgi:hypothetical protein
VHPYPSFLGRILDSQNEKRPAGLKEEFSGSQEA